MLVNLLLIAVGGELVARWRLPSALLTAGSNIYRAVDTPGVGYTLKANYRGFAFGAPLETNSFGFRGPEWSAPKRKRRVVLVGDSHAFGFGLRYEESLGPQLARRLGPSWEVLVLAAPGLNSVQERALVHSSVWPLAPDALVLVATNNDGEAALAVDAEGYLHWKPGAAETRVIDRFGDRALPPPSFLARHSRLYLLVLMLERRRSLARTAEAVPHLGSALERYYGTTAPPELVASVERPIADMILESRAHAVPFVLLTVAGTRDYRRVFADLASQMQVPLVELLGVLPAQSYAELQARYGLGWDSHYNAAAHRLWAEAAAEVVLKAVR